MVVECIAEVSDEPTELYSQEDYLSWSYDGPVLPKTDEQDRLEFLMDEIHDRLGEREGWDDDDMGDFRQLVQRFIELSKFDLSGEMSDYRVRLASTLRSMDIDDLSGEIDREASHAGRESRSGEVLEYWMKVLSKPAIARRMMAHASEYNCELVKRQLESFPQGMYGEWLSDRQFFVSRLFYNHIPRAVLWNFVSGIVFVSLTEAESDDEHQQPQLPSTPTSINVSINTGNISTPANEETLRKDFTEQDVREALQALLDAPAENGQGALMTDKAQWWGVDDDVIVLLAQLGDESRFGMILRAKGIVDATDGEWIYFDYVPGEIDVRRGSPAVTGRFCVIGSKMNEDALKELF